MDGIPRGQSKYDVKKNSTPGFGSGEETKRRKRRLTSTIQKAGFTDRKVKEPFTGRQEFSWKIRRKKKGGANPQEPAGHSKNVSLKKEREKPKIAFKSQRRGRFCKERVRDWKKEQRFLPYTSKTSLGLTDPKFHRLFCEENREGK